MTEQNDALKYALSKAQDELNRLTVLVRLAQKSDDELLAGTWKGLYNYAQTARKHRVSGQNSHCARALLLMIRHLTQVRESGQEQPEQYCWDPCGLQKSIKLSRREVPEHVTLPSPTPVPLKVSLWDMIWHMERWYGKLTVNEQLTVARAMITELQAWHRMPGIPGAFGSSAIAQFVNRVMDPRRYAHEQLLMEVLGVPTELIGQNSFVHSLDSRDYPYDARKLLGE